MQLNQGGTNIQELTHDGSCVASPALAGGYDEGMPYIHCPKCGSIEHINIAKDCLAEWERLHAELIGRNEIPKYLCVRCWEAAGKPQPWLPQLRTTKRD